ncbi:MAG: tetratricopeptide repeat protein [Microscillaceae bacterium]|nr:tetratricopeptide repeat protein [Microscillaceae bacterium]
MKLRISQCLFIFSLIFDASQYVSAQTAEEFLKLARERFETKEFFRALDYLDESLKLNPKYAEAYFLKGLAEFNLQNTVGAIENFNSAIRLNPEYLEAYFNRGLLKAGLQKYEEAIPDFDKVLAKKAIPVVFEQRGLAHFQLQKSDLAEQDFQNALKLDPKLNKSFYFLGLIDFNRAEYEQALNLLGKAITLKADYEDAYSLRVQIYLQIQDSLHALEDYGHLIQLNPYNWNAYLNRGKINFYLGNYQESLPDFERLIAKQPENPEAYFFRGRIFQSLNKLSDACKDWQKAQQLGHSEATSFREKFCKE